MYLPQLPSHPQPQLPPPAPQDEVKALPHPLSPDAGYPKAPQQPEWVDDTPWQREPPRDIERRIAA